MTPANGPAQTYNEDLTPATNPNCTASLISPEVCTVTVGFPPGNDVATFATYDGLLDGNGNPTGNELSGNQNVAVTILPGQRNQVNVVLDGIPSSVALASTDGVIYGTTAGGFTIPSCVLSGRVEVLGFDADDNIILGPGAPAPSLLSNDTSKVAVSGPTVAAPNTFTLTTSSTPSAPGSVQLTAAVTPAASVSAPVVSATVNIAYPGTGICGLPASFAFTTIPAASAGTPFGSPQSVAFTAYDASSNAISGTFLDPVYIHDSDTTGATQLVVNGTPAVGDARVASSTDTLAIGYTGLAIVPAALTAYVTGPTIGTGSFAPALTPIAYVCNGAGGGDLTECFSQTPPAIALYNATGTGSTASFTAAQTGWAGAPYAQVFSEGDTCGVSRANIATVSTVDGMTFTVAATSSPSVGSCSITLTGGAGKTLAVTVSYTATGVGVEARHKRTGRTP